MASTYTFDPNFPQTDGVVRRMLIHKGVLYVAGNFTVINGQPRNSFAAINPITDAVLPFNLSPSVPPGANIFNFLILNDVIYLCGDFTSPRNYAAAYDLSANLLPWNPNLDQAGNGIATDGTSIFIVGIFSHVNGGAFARSKAASFDAVVGTATPWKVDFDISVQEIFILGATAYIGGSFTQVIGSNGFFAKHKVVAVDKDTAAVLPAFSAEPNNSVNSIEYYNGSLYLAGGFTQLNSGAFNRTGVASVDPITGAVNPLFDAQSNSNGTRVKQRGGNLIFCGAFTSVGGSPQQYFSFLNPITGSLLPPNISLNSLVFDAETLGSRIFFGGQFSFFLGNVRRQNLASYVNSPSATTLNPLSIQINGAIQNVSFMDGAIYVFGGFTSITGANGTFARTSAAAIDPATGNILPFNPSINGNVFSALCRGGVIYIGGDFSSVNATTRNLAAALDETGALLAWDPNLSGAFRQVLCMFMFGSSFAIGGSFTTVNGATAKNNLCVVDPTTGVVDAGWQDVGTSGDTVNTVLEFGPNLYVGGLFNTVGGSPHVNAGRLFLGSKSVDNTWTYDTDGMVTGMSPLVFDLYLAGQFTQVNAVPQSGFAKIANCIVGPGTLDASWADTLATGSQGYTKFNPYISGSFFTVSGKTRIVAANVNADGSVNGFAPNIQPDEAQFPVLSFAVQGPNILLAGQFDFVGVNVAGFLAAVDSPALPVSGLPRAPEISFLNRRRNGLSGQSLTMLRWKTPTQDEQNNPTKVLGYRVYRSASKNLEDPALIAEISTTDLAGEIDTLFTEEIDGYFRYCVSAISAVGEGQMTCANFVETDQLERLGPL